MRTDRHEEANKRFSNFALFYHQDWQGTDRYVPDIQKCNSHSHYLTWLPHKTEGPNIHALNPSSVTPLKPDLGHRTQPTQYRIQVEPGVTYSQTDIHSNHGNPATILSKCNPVTLWHYIYVRIFFFYFWRTYHLKPYSRSCKTTLIEFIPLCGIIKSIINSI